MKLRFSVNGGAVAVEAGPDEMLLDVLRRELDLRSVRQTCGIGVCGACTALVDGEPFSTCILLAPLVEGKEITTVEGLGGHHPVQEAFVEAEAFQCGYCTPGMILTAKRLLEEDPEPKQEKIRNYMGGNLCRCGCYAKIEAAVNLAASARRAAAPSKGGA
ncbi:MAG: (2Fe-2S)-binding protein [Actinomycetota bacterium]|nr:(2Fe-2S)-binding protein [Actinomycetota bacterium]